MPSLSVSVVTAPVDPVGQPGTVAVPAGGLPARPHVPRGTANAKISSPNASFDQMTSVPSASPRMRKYVTGSHSMSSVRSELSVVMVLSRLHWNGEVDEQVVRSSCWICDAPSQPANRLLPLTVMPLLCCRKWVVLPSPGQAMLIGVPTCAWVLASKTAMLSASSGDTQTRFRTGSQAIPSQRPSPSGSGSGTESNRNVAVQVVADVPGAAGFAAGVSEKIACGVVRSSGAGRTLPHAIRSPLSARSAIAPKPVVGNLPDGLASAMFTAIAGVDRVVGVVVLLKTTPVRSVMNSFAPLPV